MAQPHTIKDYIDIDAQLEERYPRISKEKNMDTEYDYPDTGTQPAGNDLGDDIVFEKHGDEFVIHAAHLTQGQTVTATSADGREFEVTVGQVSVEDDGTMTSAVTFNHAAQQEKIDQAIREGHIFYTNTDNGYMIHGINLEPGSYVTVERANGRIDHVIVGQVSALDDGTMIADFETAPSFRKDPHNHDVWYVQGQHLREGDDILVPTKAGKLRHVRITQIIDTDAYGRHTATYSLLDKPTKKRHAPHHTR